jgi:hypothetical protein
MNSGKWCGFSIDWGKLFWLNDLMTIMDATDLKRDIELLNDRLGKTQEYL